MSVYLFAKLVCLFLVLSLALFRAGREFLRNRWLSISLFGVFSFWIFDRNFFFDQDIFIAALCSVFFLFSFAFSPVGWRSVAYTLPPAIALIANTYLAYNFDFVSHLGAKTTDQQPFSTEFREEISNFIKQSNRFDGVYDVDLSVAPDTKIVFAWVHQSSMTLDKFTPDNEMPSSIAELDYIVEMKCQSFDLSRTYFAIEGTQYKQLKEIEYEVQHRVRLYDIKNNTNYEKYTSRKNIDHIDIKEGAKRKNQRATLTRFDNEQYYNQDRCKLIDNANKERGRSIDQLLGFSKILSSFGISNIIDAKIDQIIDEHKNNSVIF